MKKYLSLALVFIVIFSSLCFLSGCKQVKEGGVFRLSIISDPVSIDPSQAIDFSAQHIIYNAFRGLLQYDPETSKLVPAVAKRWEISKDSKEFTFFLRDDVKFQNGQSVTASDFKYAWERVVNPANASPVAYHFSPIVGYQEFSDKKAKGLSGVIAVNDTTLKVKLSYSWADFLAVVAHPAFSPVPKEAVQKNPKAYAEAPVGNGPFKIVKWIHKKEIQLEAFDDFFGGKPRLKKLVYKIYSDGRTALKDYKAGSLEVAKIPSGELVALQKDAKYSDQIKLNPQLSAEFFYINVEKKPWNNLYLRKAFNYAINRKKLVDKAFEGLATQATGLVPRGIDGFVTNQMDYSFNLIEAKKLIKKSGLSSKELNKLEIVYPAGSSFSSNVCQIAQAQLKEAGINLKLQALEAGTLDEKISNGDFGLTFTGWIADYPLMDNFLYPLFASENKGSSNISFYSNKSIDKELSQARQIENEQERLGVYADIERKILADAPVVPIDFVLDGELVAQSVQDYQPLSVGLTPLEKAWLE
ncbi:MAG: ABC transporter substrate-binding protein [Actinobacteria bacterium]|nr:MAG: ABC transporter substrate-binding protein [Actinomycetota bacterium]